MIQQSSIHGRQRTAVSKRELSEILGSRIKEANQFMEVRECSLAGVHNNIIESAVPDCQMSLGLCDSCNAGTLAISTFTADAI